MVALILLFRESLTAKFTKKKNNSDKLCWKILHSNFIAMTPAYEMQTTSIPLKNIFYIYFLKTF